MASYVYDTHRSFISLSGKDVKSFLQGLITNDIEMVSATNSIYTALLTPQGKYLFDFFIFATATGLIIDVEAEKRADLAQLLKKYRLRSDVEITLLDEASTVYCAFGTDVFNQLDMPETPGFTKAGKDYLAIVDPRLSQMGLRLITLEPQILEGLEHVEYRQYDRHRLSLGVPEGGTDMIVDKAIPLECGLDELHAIAWDKGCYMGQELTARTKHRGLVRKRLLPVTFEGIFIPEMSPVFFNEQEVGSMRSTELGHGIALIRLEVLELMGPDDYLIANREKLKLHVMPWMQFQL